MLPWNEKVPMLSIHPDAASRDDVAKLATELMEANKQLDKARDYLWGRKAGYVKGLEDGLILIRKSTEIMEARRFAEQALNS